MATDPARSEPQRVLIIDDDAMVRDSLGMLFEHYGWAVTAIPSGRAVLEMAASLDYQLAIVDHLMEGMNGVEVTRQLKSLSSAPVFMLTGCIDPQIRTSAEQAGVDRFFSKPIKTATIIKALAEL